jgi:hypothetical protein
MSHRPGILRDAADLLCQTIPQTRPVDPPLACGSQRMTAVPRGDAK